MIRFEIYYLYVFCHAGENVKIIQELLLASLKKKELS